MGKTIANTSVFAVRRNVSATLWRKNSSRCFGKETHSSRSTPATSSVHKPSWHRRAPQLALDAVNDFVEINRLGTERKSADASLVDSDFVSLDGCRQEHDRSILQPRTGLQARGQFPDVHARHH